MVSGNPRGNCLEFLHLVEVLGAVESPLLILFFLNSTVGECARSSGTPGPRLHPLAHHSGLVDPVLYRLINLGMGPVVSVDHVFDWGGGLVRLAKYEFVSLVEI